MKTRIQNHIIQHDCPEVDLNQFPSEFLKVVQLTVQQRELFILGDEMKKSISDLYSPFQKFLKYSPDALNHLFDQCLIKPVDTQVQGDTFFDFFLFEADPWADSEMDIFATLIAARKDKFLMHPLFDAFLKLKWKKTCGLFYIYIFWVFLYQMVLIAYSLEKLSFLHGSINNFCFGILMVFGFVTLNFQCIFGFIMHVLTIHRYLKYVNQYCKIFLLMNILKCFCWNVFHPILCGFFIFGQNEEKVSRSLCAVLILMASIQSMQTLARIPKVGIQTLMMTKVFFSVFTFFSSFGAIFVSFCVIFHILLPNSAAFGKIEDSVIKVLAMLMGELDFTTNFVLNPDSNFLSKSFFVLFLIMMALVFMNLLLGLAVSDIGELERISIRRRAVVEFQTITIMEKIVNLVR